MAVSILGNVVTGPVGSRSLVDIPNVEYTFSNGLSETNRITKWGGTLVQNTELDGAYSITIGGSVPITSFAIDTTTSINLTYTAGGNSQGLLVNGTNMTITDAVNSKGLIYAGDYTSNFVTRSLVDKGWVDGYLVALPLNLIPDADGTRHLGEPLTKWGSIYGVSLTLDNDQQIDYINTAMSGFPGDDEVLTSAAIKTYVDTEIAAVTSLTVTSGSETSAGDYVIITGALPEAMYLINAIETDLNNPVQAKHISAIVKVYSNTFSSPYTQVDVETLGNDTLTVTAVNKTDTDCDIQLNNVQGSVTTKWTALKLN
jgi:hypothetical protein